MQYLHAHPDTRLPHGLRSIPVRYGLLALLIILAALELSTGQFVLLLLVVTLGFSVLDRVNRLNPATPAILKPDQSFDGGSFILEKRSPPPTRGIKIVCDGGSFERAHMKQ